MAFGNIGAPGGMIGAVNIAPAGAYAADGITWLKAQGIAFAPTPPSNLNALLRQRRASFKSIQVGQVTLTARADATSDGTAGDTGVLVTAAPAANQHGIPINFGPGRGRWTTDDVSHRLWVVYYEINTPAGDVPANVQGTDTAGGIFPQVDVLQPNFFVTGPDGVHGDLRLTFKNRQLGENNSGGGGTGASVGVIKMLYLHSDLL
jgi:hypothetical protein